MARFDDFGFPFVLYQGPVESADVEDTGTCAACGDRARFLFAKTCYGCFRAGRADHTIDTELGMVRTADAERGMTHGLALDDPRELDGYELVEHPSDPAFPRERWYSVKLPVEELRELVRTPRYHTANGERWLFHCGRPCVFLGGVTPELLAEAGPGSARADVAHALAALLGAPPADGPELLDALEDDALVTYVFRCRTCARLRGHHESPA